MSDCKIWVTVCIIEKSSFRHNWSCTQLRKRFDAFAFPRFLAELKRKRTRQISELLQHQNGGSTPHRPKDTGASTPIHTRP